MNFKKLALAAAIATVPAVGFSVESLEDGDLGTVTGQDGIEVAIAIGATGITSDIYLHDKDGFGAGNSYSYDGAIVITGMAIGVGGASVVISIDAGDRSVSAVAPILNINVALPATLTISTGSVRVANSGIDEGNRAYTGASGTIMNNMTIILGSTQLNIQLGNEQQTGSLAGSDMIVVSATVNGGVTLNNFALNDASVGGGAIGMDSMTVTDAGGANLTVAADVNVTTAGMVVGIGQLGHATNGMSLEIVNQYLGTTTAGYIGDISVVGLNLNGTVVTISGK